jgi:parallel beta-helix repeat protein
MLLVALATLVPASAPRSALAQATIPVFYDTLNNVIYVGSNYEPADPVQSPYIGYPSHPLAPKTPITIPEIAAALSDPALLESQGSDTWLLKADMVISPTARLEATSASINWLRLDSTPGTKFPALTRLIARGGHVLIQDIKVTSWAGSAVDTNTFDGRSYLLAELGGRMDIIDAEAAYLGWDSGQASGIAWRKRATQINAQTGATGSVKNSNIHDNYFGLYGYEAYGVSILDNQIHHNFSYGFQAQNSTQGFTVADNQVYNNGKHGIIFARGCTFNQILRNEVYSNTENGIVLERGSNINQISENIVYNNRDGVVIYQSEKNLVQGNQLHDNERGLRVNATFDGTDAFDGLSNENTIQGNTIENNLQYGIYLYERADKNTIQGNTIRGNTGAGVYIKTGANLVKGNTITGNGDGISIIATPATPGGLPPSTTPGQKNVIQGNTIEDNSDVGIQLQGGVDTVIGLKDPSPSPADANVIRFNGRHGISFDATSTKNTIYGNTIHGNLSDGVTIKGPASGPVVDSRNKITRNSIAANGSDGISVDATANDGIQPPTITSAPNASVVVGTAAPNVTVEIYRDANGQGKVYKGSATANGAGSWSFALPVGDNPQEGGVTALAIDSAGNTSEFFGIVIGGGKAIYEIGAGSNGELTIFVNGPGAKVTLPDIQQAIQIISPTTTLLQNQGNGVWQSNASLFLNRGVTLTLTLPTVKWLKLRSQAADIQLSASGEGAYNYKSFVNLRTYGGAILIDGVKITSWNPSANTYDTDVSNGRSYILAKYDARLDIKNADLSYLGSSDGESYGVSWRDINDGEAPDVLRTRVTGDVLNSTFSYNYYGIYTFQASYMTFSGNKFHHNIGYGFDPHDFTHHVTVENNEAYANGNHGFIISRGCNNFTFRNNKSYDNHYTVGEGERRAHGFMLDPGSPNSQFPQEPSHDNILENNQAWDNDGYGLRVVGSLNNTIKGNIFTNNYQGITLEQNSTGNKVLNNRITDSAIYGIYMLGGSDSATITGNTITGSGKHGIYFKTSKNTIFNNNVSHNGSIVDGVPSGAGISSYVETNIEAAMADLRLPGSQVSLAESDPELVASQIQPSAMDGTTIVSNTISYNADEGIELKSAQGTKIDKNSIANNGTHGVYLASGASGTMLSYNKIYNNAGYGIRANGLDVVGNQWTKNEVYDNALGGIATTSGANNGVPVPKIVQDKRNVTVTAAPGTIIEIFSDNGGQARYFEARITLDATGSITLNRSWKGSIVNGTATDADGNSSALALNRRTMKVYVPLISR